MATSSTVEAPRWVRRLLRRRRRSLPGWSLAGRTAIVPCMGSLADFPPSRRDTVLAQFAAQYRMDADAVDAAVRRLTGVCASPRHHAGALSTHAAPDRDGKYHLLDRDNALCCPSHNHDGLGAPVDATQVAFRDRCKELTGTAWPPSLSDKGRVAQLRRGWVSTFGSLLCQCCDRAYGSYFDHDHRTGVIRGLVCGDCNHFLDGCLHVDTCMYAEYLNDPPGAGLGLPHPTRGANGWRYSCPTFSPNPEKPHP